MLRSREEHHIQKEEQELGKEEHGILQRLWEGQCG